MIEITERELNKLADGMPPNLINKDWDCESVIMVLATILLGKGEERDE